MKYEVRGMKWFGGFFRGLGVVRYYLFDVCYSLLPFGIFLVWDLEICLEWFRNLGLFVITPLEFGIF
jgi:hypothetical protein